MNEVRSMSQIIKLNQLGLYVLKYSPMSAMTTSLYENTFRINPREITKDQ